MKGLVVFALLSAMSVPFAVAASESVPVMRTNSVLPTTAPVAPAPSTKEVVDQMNSITQLAGNAGILTCLQTIDKITKYITGSMRNRGSVFLPPENPDQQMMSVSFELELPNKSTAYATMSAAPTWDGNCDALYETVTYWDGVCADVAAKGYPQAKLAGALQQQILILQGGANVRIFLMPAGTHGCVAIKKEVLY